MPKWTYEVFWPDRRGLLPIDVIPQATEAVYGHQTIVARMAACYGSGCYVFVGPAEIDSYGITSSRLDQIASEMDTVFSRGEVRIFRRREG